MTAAFLSLSWCSPTEEYDENPFITIDAKNMFELFQVTDAATCIEDLFVKDLEENSKIEK